MANLAQPRFHYGGDDGTPYQKLSKSIFNQPVLPITLHKDEPLA